MDKTGVFDLEVEMSRQSLLGETLARNARKCPDLEGVIFKGRRIRYRELDERVNRLANGLLSIGIKMGDSVGLIMENRREMLEIFFAAAKIGAVNVPVNTRLAPREMAYILNNADVKILFFSGKLIETIGKIQRELPSVGTYIVLDEMTEGDFKRYDDLLAKGHPIRPEFRLKDDQDAFIIYTAGTTGNPKGAVLTHKNLIVNAMTSAQEACLSLPRRPDLPILAPKVMSITPFFHIAGVMSIIKNVVSVTPMVVMEFDPLELLKTIERERVTFLFLVPTMWLIVMDHPDFKKVVAYVVRRPGATAGANDIIVYVGGDLASYKKPKEVLFVDELPISATGKILKREIRKAYMSRLKEKE